MGPLQMIIRHPCHPSHLCQDPDSIWRTFVEQFVLAQEARQYPESIEPRRPHGDNKGDRLLEALQLQEVHPYWRKDTHILQVRRFHILSMGCV